MRSVILGALRASRRSRPELTGRVRLAWADYLFRLDTGNRLARGRSLCRRTPSITSGSPRFWTRTGEMARLSNPNCTKPWARIHGWPPRGPNWALRAEAAGKTQQAEADLVRAAGGRPHVLDSLDACELLLPPEHAGKILARGEARPACRRRRAPTIRRRCFVSAGSCRANPATMLERAIPDAGPVQARYSNFWCAKISPRSPKPVTERVVALGSEQDLDAVFVYCDRLLAGG